jgi:PAS domain S-box-containing protein
MKLVLIDSDPKRRSSLAAWLRQNGHEISEHASLPAGQLPEAEVVIVAGEEGVGCCARYHRSRRARWILALVGSEEVEAALAAGADDCLCTPVEPEAVELRLRVARGSGGLGLGLGASGTGDDGGDVLDAVLPEISGKQLRVILDNLPMPVGMVSSEGVFLQCNREFEAMFGLPPGSVAGRNLAEVFANEDVWEIFAGVAARGHVRDREMELIGHGGVRYLVAGQAKWVPSADGRGCAIGSFVDISERIDAEAALRASEASLRSVLHASPDGIIVHREGEFLFANSAALAQLGLASLDEAVGRSIYDHVVPTEAEEIRARIEEMERTGEAAPPRDIQFLRVDGETYIGEVVSICASFDGAPALITMIRDVSERRRLQSQLFLTDRLATVGTLAVGVAHEINNPLAWVVGNLGLLGDEFDNQVRMREIPGHDVEAVAASRARVRELLGRAQEGTERVRRIVRDLGRFARPDEAEGQAVDIHALLDSTIEIADVQLRHRARVVRDYHSAGFARGSEARLGQVFLNLLVNAGQAIEAGAPRQNRVRVETRDLDDLDPPRVEVAISDTGTGMPEHVRKRIFEPFFTTKPVGEGTGIGLAISHDIVTSMGGEIAVESEVGQGTTFRVRLYRAAEDQPSQPARPIREDSGSEALAEAVRVLVVDDEPLIREMVCDALSQHEVTAVATGSEALAEIMAHDWDLILCDMILPELSGLDVYREVEQQRPEVLDKLVFMTGGEFTRKGPRLPSGARVRRLEKPFSIKALRSLVREALARE